MGQIHRWNYKSILIYGNVFCKSNTFFSDIKYQNRKDVKMYSPYSVIHEKPFCEEKSVEL